MPSPPIINLPLDITGVAPTNFIQGEEHVVSNVKRAVAMNYGPFFVDGLVVKNGITDQPLTPNVDYVVGLMYLKASEDLNKPVYVFIVINNLTLTSIKVDYHAVGGEFSMYTSAIQQILDTLQLDDRPVEWGSILGRPTHFIPAPHNHRANQIGQWGDLIRSVERLTQAIMAGNQSVISELYAWVQSQLGSTSVPVASIPTAIAGEDNIQRITALNLKAVLDDRFSSANIPEFEYEMDPVDDDWGFWRHKQSGFTVCWGTTSAISSGEAYRAFYRRRFNVKPTIAGSFSNITTDATPSGTQWVELSGGIAEHTLSREGFYVGANRMSGTGNDKVRYKYIAMGFSDNTQPLSSTEGGIGVIPPAVGSIEQPVWSGAISTALVTDKTTASRLGIVFPPTVIGGGHTFNTNGQSALSQFYYTPYAGLFVDADYEISATLVSTTYNPNMVYTGLALNTWHDLGAVKAMDPSQLGSGFTWTTVGLYGGVVTLSVTIRKKTDHTKIATRTFTFDRDSQVAPPRINSITTMYDAIRVVSTNTTTKTSKVTMEIGYNGAIPNIVGYKPGTGGYVWRYLIESSDSFYSTPEPPTAHTYWEARCLFTSGGEGFSLGAGSLGVMPTNTTSPTGGWYSFADAIAAVNGWLFNTTAITTANSNVYIQFRHKTDWRKIVQMNVTLERIGSDIIPVFSGVSPVNQTVASGSLVSYEIKFPTNIAEGLGKITYSVNGIVQSDSTFTYSLGHSTWDDDVYSVSALGSSSGSTLTSGNYGGWTSLANSLTFGWQGTITQNTQLLVNVSIAKNGYTNIPEAIAVQGFTMNINV